MRRIPLNLHKCAIRMLNTGITMNAFAMNIGCSSSTIRHLRHCFQATAYGRSTT